MKTSSLLKLVLTFSLILVALGLVSQYLMLSPTLTKVGILVLLASPIVLLLKIALDMMLTRRYLFGILAIIAVLIILANLILS